MIQLEKIFFLLMLMIVCNRILFGNDLSPKLVMVIVIYYRFREISYSFQFIPV